MDSDKIIHCIGDSHSSFFSGYDEIQPGYPEKSRNRFTFFKSYRLGSVLAYSLNKLNTKERGREKFLELLDSLPSGSTLLLCFGEIDCRCHLVKQAKERDLSYQEVVQECIRNYFEVVDETICRGFKVAIWNVVPSAESNNKEYPIFGLQVERNECTVFFNQELVFQCERRNVFFLSIFDKLVTKELQTKRKYFFDSIHLGQSVMPWVLDLLKVEYDFVRVGHIYRVKKALSRAFLTILENLRTFKRAIEK